jgi:phospholipid/cholesterol/gamma-HCH transport system substrate-binding protein
MRIARWERRRLLALAALAASVLAVLVLLVWSSGDYTLRARFPDAGQLVKGALVEVAGRPVGKVSRIELSDDGQAEVVMSIRDRQVAPLHLGTRASIRAVGLASVTNRFVELSPGPPDASEISDGGLLTSDHTAGIVDLDQLFDSFDPATRKHFQGIVREAAGAFAEPTPGQLNSGLEYLHPALSQIAQFEDELLADRAALEQTVSATGTVANALAREPPTLRNALHNTSRTLDQLAAHRQAFADVLERTPAVLTQTRSTLRNVSQTLPAVDPLLQRLRPAAPGLAQLLRQLVPVTRDALPTFKQVRALLPQAQRALEPIPALAVKAGPALATGTAALAELTPIAAGLRPYSPDLIAGLFSGFGGSMSGYYDANGHYARIEFMYGGGSQPGQVEPPLPGYKTGLTSRCPGGAVEPAPDGSNSWTTAGTPDLCDPKQDKK